MNIVLAFSILILIAIAIWQVTKIFELSQGKKIYTQIADDNDNNWNGKLMFAFLIFIYGITIFSFVSYGDVLLPQAASEHGSDYDNLMWFHLRLSSLFKQLHKRFCITSLTNTEVKKGKKHYSMLTMIS